MQAPREPAGEALDAGTELQGVPEEAQSAARQKLQQLSHRLRRGCPPSFAPAEC